MYYIEPEINHEIAGECRKVFRKYAGLKRRVKPKYPIVVYMYGRSNYVTIKHIISGYGCADRRATYLIHPGNRKWFLFHHAQKADSGILALMLNKGNSKPQSNYRTKRNRLTNNVYNNNFTRAEHIIQ